MAILLDPAWTRDEPIPATDINELRNALISEPNCRLLELPLETGDKGLSHELVADPLATAGIVALTRIVLVWLRGNQKRRLVLTRSRDSDGQQRYVLDGSGISLEVVEQALIELMKNEDSDQAIGESAEGEDSSGV